MFCIHKEGENKISKRTGKTTGKKTSERKRHHLIKNNLHCFPFFYDLWFSFQTASEAGSVVGENTPKGQRSRASSISSLTSETSSFFPNISFAPQDLPSDVESEMDESSTDLSGVSKEDLYTYVKKFERRAFKYKSKFMDVSRFYCDLGFVFEYNIIYEKWVRLEHSQVDKNGDNTHKIQSQYIYIF